MGDSRKIEHATFVKRLYEKKLDKATPEKSFQGRVMEAVQAMDDEFGPKWRKVMDESGLDVMPASVESAGAKAPDSTPLLDLLRKAADEEGIGEPPSDIDEPQPTIFVVMRDRLGKRK